MLQCSHVMAMAVQKLFPGAQVTIGPAIERGFYYDFDMPEPITEKDLKAVKKEMQRIIKADLPFVKEEVSQPFCLHQQSASTWQLPHFGPAAPQAVQCKFNTGLGCNSRCSPSACIFLVA